MIDRKRTACFTGHRNITKKDIAFIEKLLDQTIDMLYQRGVLFYGAGGAYGFDMLAEQAVIRAKKRYNNIKLILVLPCMEQDKYWTNENKKQFAEILGKADKVVYTDKVYRKGCMHKRNRHLVNYSGYCITFLKENRGGTAYTVNYAKQNGLCVLNLANYIR